MWGPSCDFRAALLFGALVLGTGPALAQGTPSDETAARALFKEGLALQEKGELAAALDRYRAAYSQWQNLKILINLGTVALQLGRHLDAVEAYDRFLDTALSDDAMRPEVEKARAGALARVGTLAITVRGGAADVDLDGRKLESTRLGRVRVAPGEHALRATGARGARAERGVEVAAGESVNVELDVSAPAPAREARTEPAVPPSTSTSTMEQSTTGSALPWIVGGAGVAMLATSGVLLLLHGSATGDLDDDCLDGVCPDSSQDAIDRANTLGAFGLVALGVGAVGVGVGAVLLLGESEPARDGGGATSVRLDLTASSTGPRAAARVSF